MSERDKELAHKAWVGKDHLDMGGYTDLEKFAKLIRADERERIKAANAPEIERINAYLKNLEDAVEAEREACAKLCDEAKAARLAEKIRARETNVQL